jgi:hypothetical protein
MCGKCFLVVKPMNVSGESPSDALDMLPNNKKSFDQFIKYMSYNGWAQPAILVVII